MEILPPLSHEAAESWSAAPAGTTSQKGKLAEKLLEIDQVREEVLTDRIKASKLDIEHLECRIRPRKLAQQHLQAKLNANLCKLQQLDQSSPPLKVIMTKKGNVCLNLPLPLSLSCLKS